MAARKKKKAKRKAKRGASRKSRKSRETLVVGSKVRAYIKSKRLKCAGDLIQALSDTVHEALDSAMSRTSGNRRSTVRPVDL